MFICLVIAIDSLFYQLIIILYMDSKKYITHFLNLIYTCAGWIGTKVSKNNKLWVKWWNMSRLLSKVLVTRCADIQKYVNVNDHLCYGSTMSVIFVIVVLPATYLLYEKRNNVCCINQSIHCCRKEGFL